jgi:hypothetical protein
MIVIALGQIYAGRSEIMNLQYQAPQSTIKYDLKSIEYYKKIKDTKKMVGWLYNIRVLVIHILILMIINRRSTIAEKLTSSQN